MKRGDRAQAVRRSKFTDTREGLATDGLHAYLYHAIRTFEGAAHAERVAGIERHGFFLVDILASLYGGDEIESVLVLRSSNQYGVIGLVIEQAAKVGKSMNRRGELLSFFQTASVNVSDRDSLGIRRVAHV